MRDEKLQAVVAQSTFASEKAKDTARSDHFWKLRCRKSVRRCGTKQISKSKAKNWGVRSTFGRSDVALRGRCKGLCTLSKWAKRKGFVAFPKTMAGVRHLKRICKDAISVAAAVQETCSSELLRGVAFWSIRCDKCSTSYDLASLFRGRRSSLDRWTGKIAKSTGTGRSALHSTFHFSRKSCRIASFLMLSPSKNEDVSQNCFVFDVVNFKKWGGLADLLLFGWCQVQKLRKSRRIDVLSNSQIDR